MKKVKTVLLAVLISLTLFGCAVNQYQMGGGPKTGAEQSQRQWYILYGLVPINNVDTQAMIGNATDYKVRSAQEPLDVLIYCVLGGVTVSSRTVTVTK